MKNQMNRLAKANSPYLIQHADNPVDWFEWGAEALTKARKENKPLIISVGYAACHWCHVMAHESFMDPEIAAYMNIHFVCIKVDREERPDIDQIYLEAAQFISGTGGWPLNAFALPDGRPFFAGTYFPKAQWYELLKRIITIYGSQYADLVKQAEDLTKAVQTSSPINEIVFPAAEIFNKEQYTALLDPWEGLIDHEYGGFTSVPKFPLPAAWEFLLQFHYLTGNEIALKWVENTLLAISGGGIYDTAGGGFSRYSVDRYWKVPHFEKMLYDNAQLVSLFAHAYQVTRRSEYGEVIRQSTGFIQRELMNREGACYSSIDADSEGEEGKFYTYTLAEFKEAVDPPDFDIMADYYRITENGNWENGKNILFRKSPADVYAKSINQSPEAFGKVLNRTNQQLLYYRSRRIRPSTDEKIITAWNALMISAFLDSFHALGHKKYLDAALKTATFLCENMFTRNGILQRSYMNGNATINGFLDDYAFLAESMIRLYQSTFELRWLEMARKLTDFVLEHFSDKNSPLFHYTSDLSETLVARKPEIPDNVIPSSNSVMTHVLIRLGLFFDEPSYTGRASEILRVVEKNMAAQGPYFANYAMALGWQAFAPSEIAIIGEYAGEKNSILQKNYLPLSVISGGNEENLPLLKNKRVIGKTLIYVCRNRVCQLPVGDVESALNIIK